jgi:hypothetical protein
VVSQYGSYDFSRFFSALGSVDLGARSRGISFKEIDVVGQMVEHTQTQIGSLISPFFKGHG